MRRLTVFPCAGETLLGTLDEAPGATGVLIVSGGNEIRVGAHRGMALLAERLAAAGVPVFRFDRRGIGDSTGVNGGYAESGPDIAAAASAFRAAQPHVTRLIGFGNCDAATALVLLGKEAAFDGLILSNPWVVEESGDLPPPAAIRAHYAQRLRDPREWLRLLRGGVNIAKLFKGLRSVAAGSSEGDLATRFFAALPPSATVILAERDMTARAFADAASRHRWPGDIHRIPTDSHSFAREGDADALVATIAAAIG